jgi:hypothetical protein
LINLGLSLLILAGRLVRAFCLFGGRSNSSFASRLLGGSLVLEVSINIISRVKRRTVLGASSSSSDELSSDDSSFFALPLTAGATLAAVCLAALFTASLAGAAGCEKEEGKYQNKS